MGRRGTEAKEERKQDSERDSGRSQGCCSWCLRGGPSSGCQSCLHSSFWMAPGRPVGVPLKARGWVEA